MISIKDFHKGQSMSPYLTDGAFAKSANLDVFSQPGIARINYLPVKKSGTTVNELIYSFDKDPSTYKVTGWKVPAQALSEEEDTWTNPMNVSESDNSYATVAAEGDYKNQRWFDFTFDIPTGATIEGIELSVEVKTSAAGGNLYCQINGAYFSGGNIVSTADDVYYIRGGSQDLPVALTPTTADLMIIKLLAAPPGEGSRTYSVDHLRVRIYYSEDANLVFAAGGNNNVFQSTDSGDTWTPIGTNKGKYIKVWNGYLFAIKESTINVYKLSTKSWSEWQTNLDSTAEHFMLSSENDGNLYICNRQYVASVIQTAGQVFDHTDSGTYTYTTDHLTLYSPYRAICLCEQRENLLIGAIQGMPSSPKVSSSIFVWDRGAKEFDFPVFLSGEFVTSMVNVQNRVFVSTDLYGKVYSFSESGLTFVKQIPFDYDDNKHIRIGNKGHSGIVYWRDKILLGVSSEDGLNPAGIYGLSGKAINCEHLISTGEDGSNDDVLIGAVYPLDGDTLLYGYYDAQNEEYGIDKIKTSYNRATSYTSYFESIFYPLGTIFNKGKIDRIVVQLSRALQTGEGVIIKYRRHIGDSWTTLATKDYSADGALSSFSFGGVKNIENIQIRCELTTGASSQKTPYLSAVYLI